MIDPQRTTDTRGSKSIVGPVIMANAGVLIVFLFGPNAQHPIAPLSYAGAVVAIAGAVALVRMLATGRRNADPKGASSPTKAV